MKNENEVLTGVILYNLKSVLCQIVFSLIGCYSTFYLANKFQQPGIGMILVLAFILIPFVFNKSIKKYFSKTIKISFKNEGIVIEIFDFETDNLEKSTCFNYSEIRHCTLNAKQDNYSIMTLILRNKKNVTYTFYDEEDRMNTSEVFYKKLLAHSSKQQDEKKITLKPNILATKRGASWLKGAVLIMVVLIIVQIIYSPKTIPYSLLITILLLLRLFLRRKEELDLMDLHSDQAIDNNDS